MATNGAETSSARFRNKASLLAAANRVAAAPTVWTQTYSTADRTVANLTSATLTHAALTASVDGTLITTGATYDQAKEEENFKELATAFNLLRADHVDLLQAVSALIDDLQASGVIT